MRWSRMVMGWIVLAVAGLGCAVAQGDGGKLRVFFVDVEGGQATLFVAPGGESLLIDTGWPGNDGRDADRIVKAAKEAGVTRLDTVLLTHYHVDHAGGVPQLVERFPVGMFIDHGPNRELDGGITEKDYAEYQKVLATSGARRAVTQAGERLPVRGFDVTALSADGKVIDKPLPGAGQANPYCAASEVRAEDETENGRSLGVEIRFGKLKILDLGDLTWDRERTLMCPVNKVGTVDVLVVSHHGWYQSSSPALVDALYARVAIMDNGEKKGGSTPTLKTFHGAPGLETLWQLHYSDEGGKENNTEERFIANLDGPTDAGNWIELIADKDGSFVVKNGRTGLVQTYAAR
jgi:competence protein ComEC